MLKRTFTLTLLVCWFGLTPAQINTTRMLDMGRNAVYFEDYIVAIQYFNQVIKAKPYLAEPYFWRAYAKLCLEDWQGAAKDCSSALEINPFLPKAYYCRAYAENQTGYPEAAVKDLRQANRFEPGNIHTNQLLIDDLVHLKRYEEALQVCDSFLVSYPLYSAIRLQRSQLMLAFQDTTQALEELNVVLKANPNQDMAYAQRAVIAYEQKRYKEALSDMDQAVKRAPRRADYFGNRAIMRMQVNDLRGAMQDFDQAVELDNKQAANYFNRALLRIQIGDDNRAAEDLNTCLALAPDHYTARLQRALLQTQLGDYQTALTDYDRILTRYPDFVPAWYGRSEVKRKLRDRTGAERDRYQAQVIEQEIMSGKRKERQGNDSGEPLSAEAHATLQALDRKDADRYKSEIRGQVQYKEVLIDPMGIFTLGIPDSSDGRFRHTLAHRQLDSLNKACATAWTFCIRPYRPEGDEAAQALRQTAVLAARLQADSSRQTLRWEYAVRSSLTGDNSTAVREMTYLAEHHGQPGFYYFLAGNAHMQKAQESVLADEPGGEDLPAAIRDYQLAAHYEPDFAYIYYNLGCAQLSAHQFSHAVESFSQAIRLYGELAEAYYNRGLIYLYQGRKEAGRDDLSRAGELGLHGAYNLIRRYGR